MLLIWQANLTLLEFDWRRLVVSELQSHCLVVYCGFGHYEQTAYHLQQAHGNTRLLGAEVYVVADSAHKLLDPFLLFYVAGHDRLSTNLSFDLQTVKDESEFDSGSIDTVIVQFGQRRQLLDAASFLVHLRYLHRRQPVSLLHEPVYGLAHRTHKFNLVALRLGQPNIMVRQK